jgi:hypothetical protein
MNTYLESIAKVLTNSQRLHAKPNVNSGIAATAGPQAGVQQDDLRTENRKDVLAQQDLSDCRLLLLL